ncbi:MAG: PorP/SprF family type IX secretion system membrane protein [Saprospiraceae bacterium]
MNRKLKVLNILQTTLIVICCSISSYSQDPIFSQFYASPLQLNPAFTGLLDGPRIGVNYRNQWPFIDQAFKTYVTYNIFYDQFFPNLKSGFGLELNSDDAGDGFIKAFKINALYGYKIPINKRGHVIKGGLELGFVSLNYDWEKFIFGDQIDPITGFQTAGGPIISKELVPSDKGNKYIDAGMGILYYTPSFYLGASVKHLNSPYIGILARNNDPGSSLAPRVSIHTGFEIELIGNTKKSARLLSPSIALFKQASFLQINGGSQYTIKNLFFGLFYRYSRKNSDALIFNLGFKKDYWKLGYSFDYTLSKLTLAQGGSHEISLLFNFAPPPGKSSNVSDCFEAFR